MKLTRVVVVCNQLEVIYKEDRGRPQQECVGIYELPQSLADNIEEHVICRSQ